MVKGKIPLGDATSCIPAKPSSNPGFTSASALRESAANEPPSARSAPWPPATAPGSSLAGARAPPHSSRPCGSPVRHRQSADGPAHRAREKTRGSVRHPIPTLLPMLGEWHRVSRFRWPQRGFPPVLLAAASASRLRSAVRMLAMSWLPSWQAYSYRGRSVRVMGTDTVQGVVQTVGSVMVHS